MFEVTSMACPSENTKEVFTMSPRSAQTMNATSSAVFASTTRQDRMSAPVTVAEVQSSHVEPITFTKALSSWKSAPCWKVQPYRSHASILASSQSRNHRANAAPAVMVHPCVPTRSVPDPETTPIEKLCVPDPPITVKPYKSAATS